MGLIQAVDSTPISYIAADAINISAGSLPGNGSSLDALGDLFLRVGARTTDATAIVVPTDAGWLIPSGGTIEDNEESGGCSGALGYKFVDELHAEISGTWTNATSLFTLLYRGVDLASPILAAQMLVGTGDTVSWPALDYSDPFAWVVLTLRAQNAVTVGLPVGYTTRAQATRIMCGDSNGVMSSFAGGSVALSGVGRWITTAVALRSQ